MSQSCYLKKHFLISEIQQTKELTIMRILTKAVTSATSIASRSMMNGMKKAKLKNKNNSNLNR